MVKTKESVYLKELISNIKNCSTGIVDQPGFLVPDHTELASYCKAFLLELGYRVVKPLTPRFKAIRIDDLYNLFYERLKHYHPDLCVYSNQSRDRAIASKFLKVRMEAGDVSKKYALSECAEIILTVFEHEDEFNFNLPLTFEMFGQANCGWITSKAIQIMNKKREKRESIMIDKMIDEYNAAYIKKHGIESISFINLDKFEDVKDKIKEEGNGKEKD